jgi:hypothetical protein
MGRHENTNREYGCLWLAAGYLCAGLNLQINGLGILLPTFAGYFMIARGSYILRERARLFLYAVVPAAILAVLTVPHLAIEYIRSPISKYAFWPEIIMGYFVIVINAFALYEFLGRSNHSILKGAIIAMFWYIPVCVFYSASLELIGAPGALHLFLIESPKLVFALICYMSYRRLT